MRTSSVGRWITRVFIRLVGITLMLVIGVIQAVGTILTALSVVILKGISAMMIFVTLLLLIFGLFSWTRTLVVLAIAGSMFWVPEVLAATVLGLSVVQARLMNLEIQLNGLLLLQAKQPRLTGQQKVSNLESTT
jgi:hypothetical protein